MAKPTENTQSQIRVFAGKLVNPGLAQHNVLITVEEGKISSLTSPAGQTPGSADIDARKHTVIPGLIDIHTHGVVGEDFALDCTEKSRRFLAGRGTTAFLATSHTIPRDQYFAGLAQLRRRISRQKASGGAQILGIRSESPFLEPSLGAQKAELCWKITADNIKLLLEAAGQDLRILDISPELANAETLIEQAVRQGIIVSAAHTAADAGQMERAFRAGLRHMTHIFNATERPPAASGKGVLGVGPDEFSLVNRDMTVEVIVDCCGYHVSPYWLEILFRCKDQSKVSLISDATRISGLPPGDYPKDDDSRIILRDGEDVGWLESRDKRGLCGSAMTLHDGLLNLMRHRQIDLEDALECATLSPARLLGLDRQKGTIESGKDADLVVLDEKLQVILTIIAGEVVHQEPKVSTD